MYRNVEDTAVRALTLVRLIVLVAGFVTVFPVHAFRCGTALVQEGDRKYDVLEKCGEPDFRDSHAGAFLPGVGPIDITETWYYNRGSSRLLRILTFHRGSLRSIETGGPGFNANAARRSCQPYELNAGMSKFELLSRCGEPVARDQWFEQAGPRFHKRHNRLGTVLVEEWTYTFGPNRFRRYFRIINGRVVDIARGDKGG